MPHVYSHGGSARQRPEVTEPGKWDKPLKRCDSLKKKKEFHYTYRAGKAVSNRLFTMIYAKSRVSSTRIGFSVSKKIGNAVVRNRAKRRLREAATPLIPSVKGNVNIIFVARETSVDAPFLELRAAMEASLRRANLLREAAR